MLLLIEYIIVLPVLMTVLIILSSLADAKRSSLQTPGRTVSCFFPSFFSGSIQVVYFRVHFLRESERGILISNHMDSSPPKKRKIQKKNDYLLWQRAGTEAREGYLRFFRHCVDKHGVELVCFGKILQWKSAARAFPAPKRRSCFAPYSRKFEEERTCTYPILLWFGFSHKTHPKLVRY